MTEGRISRTGCDDDDVRKFIHFYTEEAPVALDAFPVCRHHIACHSIEDLMLGIQHHVHDEIETGYTSYIFHILAHWISIGDADSNPLFFRLSMVVMYRRP